MIFIDATNATVHGSKIAFFNTCFVTGSQA
jgi:hypothetical protein